MTPTRTNGSGSAQGLARRLVALRSRVAARREHDAAMQDPRIAAEHWLQMARSTSHGGAGCEFCR
jgi:hypothetical protein